MPLTNAGAQWFAKALMNDSPVFYNLANAHLCVGDGGGTGFNVTQPDLIGPSKFRRPMEPGYPTRSANVVTYRSLFATGEANFNWSEWGLANALAAGELFSRAIAALGAKSSATAWQLTAAITVNAT